MSKFINRFFFYSKIFLLLIAFVVTIYILLLKVDFYNESIMVLLRMFLPLLLVLTSFVVSFFFNRGNDNLFFNIACFLVLIAIIIIDYRTLLDTNIIPDYGTKYNFLYFNSNIIRIKIMLYLTFMGNLLLLFNEKKKNNKIHS